MKLGDKTEKRTYKICSMIEEEDEGFKGNLREKGGNL